MLNPWIADFTAYNLWLAPLGLLQIAAYLRRAGAELQFVDCLDPAQCGEISRTRADGTGPLPSWQAPKPDVLKSVPRRFKFYGISPEDFDRAVKDSGKIDGVFVTSSMTYWYPGVQFAVERIKKLLGPVPVILGGIYATLLQDHARAHSGADFVISGPVEEKLAAVLDEIFNIKISQPLSWERQHPAYSLFSRRGYLPFMTSRGCPFRCSYCASARLWGGFSELDWQACLKRLLAIKKNFSSVKNIVFYDDALFWRREERIKPLLRAVVKEGLDFSFHTPNGLHVAQLDAELARSMKQAGFRTLHLSLESSSEEFFFHTRSGHKRADLGKAVKLLQEAGFSPSEIEVYLLIGLPEQQAQEVEESMRYAGRAGVRVRLAYFSPVPGTDLWREMVEKGYLKEDSDPLLQNKVLFPYLWPGIGSEELIRLKALQRRINCGEPAP